MIRLNEGVPSFEQGMEVTLNFYCYNITNNEQTFYTDANGLAMQ